MTRRSKACRRAACRRRAAQANYWDYTAIEEAAVKTIGNSAEVPSRGVNLNALVKSGGNDFHSSISYNKTPVSTQADNIDDKLRAQGIGTGNAIADRHSMSADLGGRIIRDKLWFYTAWRRQIDDQAPLNTFMPDGTTPAVAHELSWFNTNKVSWQMSPQNKFIGFYAFNHKYDTSNLSQFIPWDSRGGLMTPSVTYKAEWQKLYGSKLVTSFQYGFWTYDSHYWSFADRSFEPTFDQTTQMNHGPQTTIGQRPHNPRNHFKGSATTFQPDLFYGSHEFKFGFDYVDNWFGRQYPLLDPDTTLEGAYSSWVYNYRLIFQNSNPFQIEVWNNPALAKVVTHYGDAYFTDQWTVARRLTMNLGLRYAHDNGFVPEFCREAAAAPGNLAFPAGCRERQQFNVWDSVAPRMHAAYDITGDGKTLVKGGWGRFDHERQQVPELDAADALVRTTVTYRWNDLNGNKKYDIGEVNLDPQGPGFVTQSGGSNTYPNASEVQPKSDEFSLSFERELMANFSARLSGIYSKYHNTYRIVNELRPYSAYNIPVVRPDPGPDGTVGTADDPGRTFTYWEYSTDLQPRSFEHFSRVNDPNADQTYKSLDFAVFKRLSNNWQLLASYSGTMRDVPISVSASGSEFNGNVESGPLNPNAEINTREHGWESSTKFSGVYRFPWDIMASGQWELRSGYFWARQVRFTGGRTITSITLNVEPVETNQLPSSSQLDVRAEKSFNLGKRSEVRGTRQHVQRA